MLAEGETRGRGVCVWEGVKYAVLQLMVAKFFLFRGWLALFGIVLWVSCPSNLM